MSWEDHDVVRVHEKYRTDCKIITFLVGLFGMLVTIIYVKLHYTGNI